MADNSDKTYKFMTNILAKSRHRTRDVRQLRNITPDTQVSYGRILIAVGLSVALITAAGGAFASLGARTKYVGAPLIIATVACAMLIVLFILPSRQKSMLSSVLDLIVFWVNERSRRMVNPNAAFTNVGIDSVDNGVLYFSNGDVGLMYDIEGQISFSVLPIVANATAEERHRYFVARADSTKELMLTSVRKADVRSKLDNLKGIYRKANESDEPWQQWVSDYAALCYNYIDANMARNETQIFQVLILRDSSISGLEKARQTFEAAYYSGMYARVNPVADDAQIAARLSSLTMLSKDGLEALQGTIVDDVLDDDDEPSRAERVSQAEDEAYASGTEVIVYSNDDDSDADDDSVESMNTRDL